MGRNVIVDDQSLRYIQTVSVGPHAFHADEPVEAGGNDEGPDPFELLLASLGTCVSITARMYADRKGWPLERVHVELSWAKFFDDDDPEGDLKSAFVEGIEMEISFAGDLSGEQRRRLTEIANRCPIHRTISAPIPVRTKLQET
ncbi:MAG TPA: OsmC family protein [Pyrinomonadaceae bacterium]